MCFNWRRKFLSKLHARQSHQAPQTDIKKHWTSRRNSSCEVDISLETYRSSRRFYSASLPRKSRRKQKYFSSRAMHTHVSPPPPPSSLPPLPSFSSFCVRVPAGEIHVHRPISTDDVRRRGRCEHLYTCGSRDTFVFTALRAVSPIAPFVQVQRSAPGFRWRFGSSSPNSRRHGLAFSALSKRFSFLLSSSAAFLFLKCCTPRRDVSENSNR